LDAAELLRAAETETGLSDYGDPTFPERFANAVDHLNGLELENCDALQHPADRCVQVGAPP